MAYSADDYVNRYYKRNPNIKHSKVDQKTLDWLNEELQKKHQEEQMQKYAENGFGAGVASGAASVYSGYTGFLNAVLGDYDTNQKPIGIFGMQDPADIMTAKQEMKDAQKGFKELEMANAPSRNWTDTDIANDPMGYITDPSGLRYSIGNQVGFMVGTAPLGIGGGMAAKIALNPLARAGTGSVLGNTLAGRTVNTIGRLANSKTGTGAILGAGQGASEAIVEGGLVYRDLIEQGKSPEEASAIALDVAAKNIPTSAAAGAAMGGVWGRTVDRFTNPTTGSRVLNAGKALVFGAPMAGVPDAAQEIVQEGITGQAKGEKVFDVYSPETWGNPLSEAQRTAAVQALITSGVLGGLPSAVGASIRRPQPQDKKKPAALKANATSGNEEIDRIILEKSKQYGIDPDLVHAVIRQESGYRTGVESSAGAVGLMQLMPGTAKDLGVTDRTDPEQNIDGGIRYLLQMYEKNGKDWEAALASYNGGYGNRNATQTRLYAHDVLNKLKKIKGEEVDTDNLTMQAEEDTDDVSTIDTEDVERNAIEYAKYRIDKGDEDYTFLNDAVRRNDKQAVMDKYSAQDIQDWADTQAVNDQKLNEKYAKNRDANIKKILQNGEIKITNRQMLPFYRQNDTFRGGTIKKVEGGYLYTPPKDFMNRADVAKVAEENGITEMPQTEQQAQPAQEELVGQKTDSFEELLAKARKRREQEELEGYEKEYARQDLATVLQRKLEQDQAREESARKEAEAKEREEHQWLVGEIINDINNRVKAQQAKKADDIQAGIEIGRERMKRNWAREKERRANAEAQSLQAQQARDKEYEELYAIGDRVELENKIADRMARRSAAKDRMDKYVAKKKELTEEEGLFDDFIEHYYPNNEKDEAVDAILEKLRQERNERIVDLAERLRSEATKGVDIIVGDDSDGRGVRQSNNEEWYKNLLNDYGVDTWSRIKKGDREYSLLSIARDMLLNGDEQYEGDPTYIELEDTINGIEAYKNKIDRSADSGRGTRSEVDIREEDYQQAKSFGSIIEGNRETARDDFETWAEGYVDEKLTADRKSAAQKSAETRRLNKEAQQSEVKQEQTKENAEETVSETETVEEVPKEAAEESSEAEPQETVEEAEDEKTKLAKEVVAKLDISDINSLATKTTIDKTLVGKSKGNLYQIALQDMKKKIGKVFTDPLGDNIYFAPGNTETLEAYTLHLVAGQNNPLEDIRVQRVLGLLLADETIKKPWAIIKQKSNGRKAYIAVYQGANNMTSNLIVGVEEGQDGRVVTSMLTSDKKGDKKAALREIKKRVSDSVKVLYVWEGLTERPRPSSDQQASQSDARLDLSGEDIIPQAFDATQEDKNVKKESLDDVVKASEVTEEKAAVLDAVSEDDGFLNKLTEEEREAVQSLKKEHGEDWLAAMKAVRDDATNKRNQMLKKHFDFLAKRYANKVTDTWAENIRRLTRNLKEQYPSITREELVDAIRQELKDVAYNQMTTPYTDPNLKKPLVSEETRKIFTELEAVVHGYANIQAKADKYYKLQGKNKKNTDAAKTDIQRETSSAKNKSRSSESTGGAYQSNTGASGKEISRKQTKPQAKYTFVIETQDKDVAQIREDLPARGYVANSFNHDTQKNVIEVVYRDEIQEEEYNDLLSLGFKPKDKASEFDANAAARYPKITKHSARLKAVYAQIGPWAKEQGVYTLRKILGTSNGSTFAGKSDKNKSPGAYMHFYEEAVAKGYELPKEWQKLYEDCKVGRKYSAGFGVGDLDVDVVPRKRMTEEEIKLQEVLEEAFGVDIIFCENADKEFNGFYNGKIYINRNSKKDAQWIVSHELTHHLANREPEVFRAILEEIDSKTPITDKQIEKYRKRIYKGDKLSEDDIIEEMVADEMNNVLKQTGIMKSIAKKDPSLAERIVEVINSIVQKLRELVYGKVGLDKKQGKALEDAVFRLAGDLKDEKGNHLFSKKDGYLTSTRTGLAIDENIVTDIVADKDGHVADLNNKMDNVLGREVKNSASYGSNAQAKLKRDEEDFSKLVDSYTASNKNVWKQKNDGKLYRVMDMPLVLQMLGAPDMTLSIYGSGFKHILDTAKHPGMDESILKQLPSQLADPLMVVNDRDKYVAVIELKDNNGATIVVPVEINKEDDQHGIISVINSMYGRVDKKDNKTPNYRWFQANLRNNNVVYINKEKSTRWAQAIREEFPMGLTLLNGALSDSSINTESELVNLKNQHPTKYSWFSRKKQNKQKTYSHEKIVKDAIEKLTGLKVAWGHIDEKTNVVYDKKQGVIRSRDANNWRVVIPKVAEAVAAKMNVGIKQDGDKKIIDPVMRDYITDYIFTGAQDKTETKEAKALADALRENPEVAENLEMLKAEFDRYNRLSQSERAKEGIEYDTERHTTWGQKAAKAVTMTVDEYFSIYQMAIRLGEKFEKEGKDLPPYLNPYILARNVRGAVSQAAELITLPQKWISVEGTRNKKLIDQYVKSVKKKIAQDFPAVSRELIDAFKPLELILADAGVYGNKEKVEDLTTFMVARRMLELHERNERDLAEMMSEVRQEHPSWKDAEVEKEANERLRKKRRDKIKLEPEYTEAISEEEHEDAWDYHFPEEYNTKEKCEKIIGELETEQFIKAANEIYALQELSIAIQWDSGLLSRKSLESMKESGKYYVPLHRVIDDDTITKGDSTKKLKGSSRRILSPLEAIAENVAGGYVKAQRNKALAHIAQTAKHLGEAKRIELVDNNKPQSKNVVSYFVNGERSYVEAEPELAAAMARVTRPAEGITMGGYLTIVSRWCRGLMTTHNPEFAPKNFFYDALNFFLYLGGTPFDVFKGMKHTLLRDAMFQEYQMSGASQSVISAIDKDYFNRNVLAVKDQGIAKQAVGKAAKILGTISEFSENAIRVAAYEKVKKQTFKKEEKAFRDRLKKEGKSNAEIDAAFTQYGMQDALDSAFLQATYESRDLTDFGSRGDIGATLNRVSWFANAILQGGYKSVRAFNPKDPANKGKVKGRAFRLGLMVASQILLAWAAEDDDEITGLSDADKFQYFHKRVGDTIIRIPKGEDLGLRALTYYAQLAFDKRERSYWDLALPIRNAVPDFIMLSLFKPILETYINYSLFYDGEIVPKRLQNPAVPAQEYDSFTSKFARDLGEQINWSPKKIDYLMNGYLGGLGRGGRAVYDWAQGKEPKEPPVIRQFTVAEGKTSVLVGDAYDKIAEQEGYYKDWQERRKKESGAKPDPKFERSKYPRIKIYKKRLQDITKKIRENRENEKIPQSRRDAKNLTLIKQRNDLAEKILFQ